MELNIEPLIYETELLIKDILTTEATEAGLAWSSPDTERVGKVAFG